LILAVDSVFFSEPVGLRNMVSRTQARRALFGELHALANGPPDDALVFAARQIETDKQLLVEVTALLVALREGKPGKPFS
jgi:hypothetical protein